MCDASTSEKISSSSELKKLLSSSFPVNQEAAEPEHPNRPEITVTDTATILTTEPTNKPSYSVAYKGRSNNELHREDLQKICKQLIGQGATVDYKNPEY